MQLLGTDLTVESSDVTGAAVAFPGVCARLGRNCARWSPLSRGCYHNESQYAQKGAKYVDGVNVKRGLVHHSIFLCSYKKHLLLSSLENAEESWRIKAEWS